MCNDFVCKNVLGILHVSKVESSLDLYKSKNTRIIITIYYYLLSNNYFKN